MMAHTKGPWKTFVTDWGVNKVTCDEFLGTQVLEIASLYVAPGFSSVEDNARLIAAAPELLEACEALVELVNDLKSGYTFRDSDNFPTLDKARAVIAGAKGTS
jgi:hypothetical protein